MFYHIISYHIRSYPILSYPFLSYSQPSFHFSTPICYTWIHYSHLSLFPSYFSFHLSYPNPLLFLSFYFSYSISLILSLLYHLSHSILFFLSLSFYSLYSIPPSLSFYVSQTLPWCLACIPMRRLATLLTGRPPSSRWFSA